jgi:ribosome-associated heat shock protein Hsp15
MAEDIRIDKFLWAVRIYKTRTLATEACGKGQITINGVAVKASRSVKVGETLLIRKPPIVRSYKVLGLLGNRLSAEKVKEFIEETTPQEEFMKLEMARMQFSGKRDRGTGRPTKKERRDIDEFQDGLEDDF